MKAGKTAQAIFFMSKQNEMILYSKDDYDAQMLMFAIYDFKLMDDTNLYEEDNGDE